MGSTVAPKRPARPMPYGQMNPNVVTGVKPVPTLSPTDVPPVPALQAGGAGGPQGAQSAMNAMGSGGGWDAQDQLQQLRAKRMLTPEDYYALNSPMPFYG